MLTTALVLTLLTQIAQRPVDVQQLRVSNPVAVVELSSQKLRGAPIRLSWSPDGRLMYLRTVERDIWANEKEHHYLLGVTDGRILTADAEPDWSAKVLGVEGGVQLSRRPRVQDRDGESV